jgi:hypothetical protein
MNSARTPWLKMPLFWLLAALFVAVLCGRAATLERKPNQAMHPERGYKAAVDQLVAKGCLKPRGQGGGRQIVFTGAKGCPSQAQFDAYAKASFLAGDMAGLIDQRWQFGSDGSGLALRGIRPSAHAIRFAAGDQGQWGGAVLYAKGYGEPVPGYRLAGSKGVRDTPCDAVRTDGRPEKQKPELGQYIWCDGAMWQRVARIESMSERKTSVERVREPTLAGAVKRLEVPNMSGDVESSIRHNLHFAVQRVLEDHLATARNTPGKKEKTVRAGLLLMDGLTGEIHAAATHPAKLDDIGTDRQSHWLSRNWNFERLPIGSTAKIPFAAAIAQANPALLTQRAPVKYRAGYCGGVQNCKDRAREGLGLDFRQFIARSSNGHALWLLDQARRGKAEGWQDNLRRFACVEPDLAQRDPGCADNLWVAPDGAPLGNAEPLLAFDMANARKGQLYYDYYITILGGIKSSWTNANLAQAYARIFSDRPVNPQLSAGGTAATGSLGIEMPVWSAVRDGMKGVLTDPGGTARPLCADLPCVNANQYGGMWLYAKTGTATISTAKDNSKTLVLLAVATKNGQAPEKPQDISRMKVIVITQRFSGGGKDALQLAQSLFLNGAFQQWLGLQTAAPKIGDTLK